MEQILLKSQIKSIVYKCPFYLFSAAQVKGSWTFPPGPAGCDCWNTVERWKPVAAGKRGSKSGQQDSLDVYLCMSPILDHTAQCTLTFAPRPLLSKEWADQSEGR